MELAEEEAAVDVKNRVSNLWLSQQKRQLQPKHLPLRSWHLCQLKASPLQARIRRVLEKPPLWKHQWLKN